MLNKKMLSFGNSYDTLTAHQKFHRNCFRLGFIAGFITAFLIILIASIFTLFP